MYLHRAPYQYKAVIVVVLINEHQQSAVVAYPEATFSSPRASRLASPTMLGSATTITYIMQLWKTSSSMAQTQCYTSGRPMPSSWKVHVHVHAVETVSTAVDTTSLFCIQFISSGQYPLSRDRLASLGYTCSSWAAVCYRNRYSYMYM